MANNQEDQYLRKGPWEEDEDVLLKAIVQKMGEGRWDSLAQASGLLRSGKSCGLRWMNYLRPNLKHDKITEEEEAVIIQLQQQWGNKWSKMAKMLPGRTDNELKNYWRLRVRKEQSQLRKLEMYANVMSSNSKQESSNAGMSESLSINGANQESDPLEKIVIQDDNHNCAQPSSDLSGFDYSSLETGSSEFAIPYSPYETCLSHYWMSDFRKNNRMDANLGTGFELLEPPSQDCFYSLWNDS